MKLKMVFDFDAHSTLGGIDLARETAGSADEAIPRVASPLGVGSYVPSDE